MKRLKLKKILSGVLILGSITTAIGCTENNIKENNITENNIKENNISNIVNSVDNQEVENDDNQLKEEVIDKGEVTDKDTTDVLVEMVTSAREITGKLNAVAKALKAEADRPEFDLFGAVEKRPAAEVITEALKRYES